MERSWWGNWKSNLPDHSRCVWSCSCRWGRHRLPEAPPPPTPPSAYTSPKLHHASLCLSLSFFHFSLSVSDLASFLLSLFHSDSPEGKLISTVWEQTHSHRHRQLRIAQGPLPHPPSPFSPSSSSSPPPPSPSCPLVSSSSSFLPPLPPHTPLLRVEEASFIPPFCPLFLPGFPSFSSLRPSWVLLLLVPVWTVAVGGWRIALSRRARAGSTCSACSDTDSEYSISRSQPPNPLLPPPSRTVSLSLKRLPLLLLVSHACTWLCHYFCQTEGHVHVLYKCQKTRPTEAPPAEWPSERTRGGQV